MPHSDRPETEKLRAGTIVKVNGIPYELVEDVTVKGESGTPDGNPALGQGGLVESQVIA